MAKKHTFTLLLFAIAFLATGVLPFCYSWKYGVVAALSSFAGDAFYYLGLTQRSRSFQGFTFDGLYATNGFHPLWQWLLTGLARMGVLNFAEPLAVILRVFRVNILLLALAAGVFCVAASGLLRRRSLALLISSPGPVWLVIGLATPGMAATWSFANGMESALSWLCFSLALSVALLRAKRETIVRNGLLSVLLGLTVLARLDEIFMALCILAVCFWTTDDERRFTMARSVPLVGPFFLLLSAYLGYNKFAVGALLPLSGAAKAGIGVWENLHRLAWLLLPIIRGEAPTASGAGPGSTFNETYIRMAQMLVPMLLALLELFRTRSSIDRTSRLLHALYLGVVLKALYNFLFVALYHQGFWYYTVSIAIANFVVVRWLDEVLYRLHARSFSAATRGVAGVGYGCAVLLSFNLFMTPLKLRYGTDYPALFQDGPALGAELRRQGDARILEFTDGAISYALAMPAESAFGLALDAQATAAANRGQFLETMQSRGVTLAVSQGGYSAAIDQYFQEQRWKLGLPLFAIHASEFRDYTLVYLRHDPVHNLDFYRIQRLR